MEMYTQMFITFVAVQLLQQQLNTIWHQCYSWLCHFTITAMSFKHPYPNWYAIPKKKKKEKSYTKFILTSNQSYLKYNPVLFTDY